MVVAIFPTTQISDPCHRKAGAEQVLQFLADSASSFGRTASSLQSNGLYELWQVTEIVFVVFLAGYSLDQLADCRDGFLFPFEVSYHSRHVRQIECFLNYFGNTEYKVATEQTGQDGRRLGKYWPVAAKLSAAPHRSRQCLALWYMKGQNARALLTSERNMTYFIRRSRLGSQTSYGGVVCPVCQG